MLQLVLGKSGSGKTYTVCKNVIDRAVKDEKSEYIIIVPEQFTMETQKDMVMMHPRHGLLNIDILSFDRLAYRVFDELGMENISVLDDTGKNLIIRKIIEEKKDELKIFKNKTGMQGFVAEIKSVISEFMQYGIDNETIDRMIESSMKKPMLNRKLEDIRKIDNSFREYLGREYITSEGLLDLLCSVVSKSEIVKRNTFVFDGFTGFTPIQYKLLSILLSCGKDVIITVTIPRDNFDIANIKEQELFAMSKKMIAKLNKIAVENNVKVRENLFVEHERSGRQGLVFLEKNIFRSGNIPNTKDNAGIHLTECNTPREEMIYVVDRINHLVREQGLRYRDVAVVTGDMERYYRAASEIFQTCSIPAFIDHKRNILDNPAVETIRSAIGIVTLDFSYESVFRFLRTGMSGIDEYDIDKIDNYCLGMGIRGYNLWDNEWTYTGKIVNDDELAYCNKIRQRIIDILRPLRIIFKDKNSDVKAYTTAIYDLMLRLNIKEQLENIENIFENENEKSKSKEYGQTYSYIIDLLDQVVALMGNERISIKDYSDILDSGFEEIKVGIIPPGVDQVIVGDITRTRLNHIKVMFFVGVNDGVIPAKTNGRGIISEADRIFLSENEFELSPTARENSFIQKYYLYLSMTKPTDDLYISYSKGTADGSSIRPSYLIDVIADMFSTLKKEEFEADGNIDIVYNINDAMHYIANGIDEYKSGVAGNLWKEMLSFVVNNSGNDQIKSMADGAFKSLGESKISRAVADALYGGEDQRSISRLEKFAACAYSHFLTYGLALVERKEYSIEMADIGTLYHNSLEEVSKMIRDTGLNWRELEDDSRKELVKSAVESVVSDFSNTALTSTARNLFTINKLERVLDKTVWALSKQISQGRFEPAYYEFSISKGRVDRIDLYENGDNIFVKIIDYKTGTKTFSIVDAYYGTQMQLVLYMKKVMNELKQKYPEKNILPGAMLYYNIKDPFVSKDTVLDETGRYLKEFMPSGLINARPDVVEALDKYMESDSNVIKVAYKKDGNYTATSTVATDEQFDDILEYVAKKSREINDEINEGHIEVKPYLNKKKTPCNYCKFKSICGFDENISGYEYNRFDNLKAADVWEKIKED